MKATDILSQEHRVIEQVLNALESGAAQAQSDGKIQPQFFMDAADFIKGFADGCHHHKEEGVLFEMMSSHGVPVQNGPIGAMLHDHELGRFLTREMRAGAEKWQNGDESGRGQAVKNALGYVNLLRMHIYKEDHILFPMANRAIPAEEYDDVLERFEKVEHEETGEGVHEQYLALAEKLSKAV